MGNLVMPKNSAEYSEMKAVLKVYYDANDWIDNSVFIDEMKKLLGEPIQEPQAYTKKTQIPSYFGFTIWEDLSKSQSKRKITESGKRFYEGLLSENELIIQDELMKSLETQTFGRNVCGCNSDSDIEPPQIFIKSLLLLGYLTRQEYGYILWQLDEKNENLFNLVTTIAVKRIKNVSDYPSIPPKYADAKPITALLNWNFLQRDGKIGGQDKIILNENVFSRFINRLTNLRIYNNEIQKFTLDEELTQEKATINLRSINKIFYGAPGTGKSHKIKDYIRGKEDRTERITFHPEYDYNSFVGGYKPTMYGNDIRYEFVPQAFIKIYCDAWNSLASGEDLDFYLVIEEINRGNCAEIFGDIFQLLDRNADYDISASKELKEFLLKEDDGLKNKDFGLKGGKLTLPPNLNILATMNTSDQSLFPMDSAFKRRWNWEYVRINYDDSVDNESSKFKVKLSNNEFFSWLSFIKEVNDIIKRNDNLGMDKCLGNYFIKPEGGFIDIEPFINKVIFYLWNDVFKDEMEDNNIFLNKTSYEDFFPTETNGIIKIKEIIEMLKIEILEKVE